MMDQLVTSFCCKIHKYSFVAHSELVKVTQSCPTLCHSTDYIVHGILQARILERIAFPFSRGSSQPRDQTQVSRIEGGFFTSWATREAQEYWSRYPIPSPGDLHNPGIELGSPTLQVDSLPTELLGKPKHHYYGKCHYSELKKYPLMVLPIQRLPVFPLHGLPFHTYAYLYTYVFVFTYYFIFIYRSTYSLKKIILFI